MAKRKFWTAKNLIEVLKLIGDTSIGAIALYLFQERIQAKNDKIDALNMYMPSNVRQNFEDLKKYYEGQIEFNKKLIADLKASGSSDSSKYNYYRTQILELETKLSILAKVSDDATKRIAEKFGKDLKYSKITPFAFFKLYDEKDSAKNSFKTLYKNWFFEEYNSHDGPLDSLPPNPFVITGFHSPLYYSFDNVDLKTASFKNSDLRGVDLSLIVFDSATKFPDRK